MPSPATILIIEDDTELAEWISQYLQENNFSTDIVGHGDQVDARFRSVSPDLVLLDINLPGKNGFEICQQLRQHSSCPIIMVTANDQELDEVLGLELGADDYITKPVTPRVLLARIKSQLRKLQQQPQQSDNKMQFGALTIDLDAQSVILNEQVVALSSGEFELLWVLASHAGKEVKREDLIREIRGFDYDGFDRTIDVRISRLRKKLDDNADQPRRIKTIWGKGYLFVKNAW
ncbi:MAG: response regulator [Gammaproteobacteria bacterium]|nr:response regulator [Gammaproteobacteria bacterium]